MQEMLSYEEFKEKIKEEVTERLDTSKRVLLTPILKNNGMVIDGLIIMEQCRNISPTIYLNPYYDKYMEGEAIDDIIEDVTKTYKKHLPTKDFDISQFRDFENASKNIVFKLVSKEANKKLLEDVPYVEYQDLALIFVCVVNNFRKEYATILIHNAHANMWGVDAETLYQIALQNTPNIHPYKFDCLDYLVRQQGLSDTEDVPMYILTNWTKIFGATCMVYPTMLKRIADFLQDNLIIIPSSVHEVLIIPESDALRIYTMDELNEMIVETNETVVGSDEVLGDHAYRFDRECEEITF